MEIGQRYAKLLDLAREDSSERRRDLLSEVTEMFFENSKTISASESHMFGELMAKVAFELNTEVRHALSIRFEGGEAPRSLAIALAGDEIEVAAPILRNTLSFTDDDLVDIVAKKGTQYQMAVSQRAIVSEIVSDALVDHGNDDVVKSLLENQGARIGEKTYDKVVVRAEKNEALHAPMIGRQTIPLDTLNQLFSIVAGPMKQEIIEKYSQYSEKQIQEAMEKAKARVGMINHSLPDDFEAKKALVKAQKAQGKLVRQQLPNIWRSGDKTTFYLSFAEISGLDYMAVSRPFEAKDVDSIAIICRANDFERALFVTIAVFVLGQDGMGAAEKLGNMYNSVPQEAAARALRFMQVKVKAAA